MILIRNISAKSKPYSNMLDHVNQGPIEVGFVKKDKNHAVVSLGTSQTCKKLIILNVQQNLLNQIAKRTGKYACFGFDSRCPGLQMNQKYLDYCLEEQWISENREEYCSTRTNIVLEVI